MFLYYFFISLFHPRLDFFLFICQLAVFIGKVTYSGAPNDVQVMNGIKSYA